MSDLTERLSTERDRVRSNGEYNRILVIERLFTVALAAEEARTRVPWSTHAANDVYVRLSEDLGQLAAALERQEGRLA